MLSRYNKLSTYIATFFSHFGAIRFRRSLLGQGISCQLMPVPRSVSSSCGTCVQFEAKVEEQLINSADIEALFIRTNRGFEKVLSNL